MSVFFIFGDDDFLIEEEIKLIKTQILGDEVNSLNFKTVDNPDYPTFVESLCTTPLMFGKMLLHIKCERYFLNVKNKIDLDEAEAENIIYNLQNLNENFCVILSCQSPWGEGKKPDARKKFYKQIEKIAQPKSFMALKPWETYKALSWLKPRLGGDLKFSSDVLEYFVNCVGVNFRELISELEKLKLSIYPEKMVKKAHIDAICAKNQDVFKFCDLILEKNKEDALIQLQKILQSSHYLPLLALLQSSVRKWILVKIYSETMNNADVAKKIGMHPFMLEKTQQKLKNTPLEALLRLKINITDAEFNIKTGAMENPVLALEVGLLK